MLELSALELNQQIVTMRKVVNKARVRLSRRLIRYSQKYKRSKDEKKKRKVTRFMEEIKAVKDVHSDDITKFALINTKSLKELPLKKSTPAERAFYKLAVEENVTEAVEGFRKKYSGWKNEVPFILQRLGLQYQNRKNDNKHIEFVKVVSDPIIADSPARSSANYLKLNSQDVVGTGKRFKKTKRKKQFEVEKRVSTPFSLPEVCFHSTSIIKGQGLIKKLNLDQEFVDDSPSHVILNSTEESQAAPSSSFFLLPTQKGSVSLKRSEQQNKTEETSKSFEKQKDLHRESFKNKLADDLPIELEGLHPSWVAKKRQRQLMGRLKNGLLPKKTVFSNDD